MRSGARALRRAALSILAALAVSAAYAAGAAPVPLRAAGAPRLLIYNNDLALVRESRAATLPRGAAEVVLEGVPARLDSTSMRLEGKGISVLRQSFRYDLWDADRVFRRFLGDTIVYRYQNRTWRGVLAGIDGDDLFITRRDSVGLLSMVKRSQVSEIEFPPGKALATRPVLAWIVESASAGEIPMTLSYLAAGLQWSAEYSARLARDERSVELSGWATIVNRSGATFEGAAVTLVAGEVHRAGESPDRGTAALGAEGQEPSSPGGLFAYHAYPMPGTVDLHDLETIQAPLFKPARVPARRTYAYDGARDGSKVRVRVVFGNEKDEGLGLPLPAGRVRVYTEDPAGAAALVGEDAIGHTAAGQTLDILSGIAYDLAGSRTRLAHTRVSRNVTEDRFEIRVRNGGRAPATVVVTENLFGSWEITEKSADFRKKDAETVEFELSVPAGGETTLTYTVRYSF